MQLGRLYKHVLFWLVYYIITLFNELYLSESFSLHPTSELFFQCALSCLLLISIKAVTTYAILYYLIPAWIKTPGKVFLFLEGLFIILTGALLIRFALHFIIWPYIYDNVVSLSPVRLTARYFYSLLDLLQIVGIASAIKLYKLRMQAKEKESELVKEKLKTEILHLKSQINPHFLFNTLNSLYALALTQSNLTADALMRLSKILRYILYEADSKTGLITNEIKILEDYIALQQLRFSGRIQIIFTTETDNEHQTIAPLLLLPLIENAYKHSNDINAIINFKLNVKNNNLNVTVTNPVIEESIKHEAYSGIGLKNIERQLELLYTNYSLNHKVENKQFVLNLFIDLTSYANIELSDNRR